MSGLHPDFPCKRVVPSSSKTVTKSTTDLSNTRACGLCPAEGAPA